MAAADPAGKTQGLTPGNTRFVLILVALLCITVSGIAFTLMGMDKQIAFTAIVAASMLVLGTFLSGASARQMADALKKPPEHG